MSADQRPLSMAEELVERIKDRFDYVKVHAVRAGNRSLQVREGKTEESRFAETVVVRVAATKNNRTAVITSSDITDSGLGSVADSLADMLTVVQPDPVSVIPDPGWLGVADAELDLEDPSIAGLTPEELEQTAKELERLALAEDDRLVSGGAEASAFIGETAFASSFGISMEQRESHVSKGVQLSIPDGSGTDGNTGRKQRNGWFTSAIYLEDLEATPIVARTAARRTISRLGSQKPESGKTRIMFDPICASRFFGYLARALSGSALYRGESFLCDKIGAHVGSSLLSLDEKPLLPRGMGSRRFDNDGLPARNFKVIHEGELQAYLLGVYASRKLNMQPNGCAGGSSNLVVQPGNKSFTDLLEETGDGILITGLMGQGADIRTGDFSMGAEGFRISGGQIVAPVSEFTISSTFQEMLNNIEVLGNDPRLDRAVRAPSMMIREMIVAGA